MDKDTKRYGFTNEELAEQPTAFRDDLFRDRVVLVSGGGSGIGKAIAFLFARLGAKVAICGRDEAKLEGVANALADLGAECSTHSMTIRDPEAVESLIGAMHERHGRLDVLINNAGGQFPQMAIDFSVKGWNAVMDTNLNGTWYMMQAAAKRWRDAGSPGCIVNIVADVWRGLPGIAHAAAARVGIITAPRPSRSDGCRSGSG